jgi:hypothetical protein
MLTDARVRALRMGRVSDGRGLYVIVLPSGTKAGAMIFAGQKKPTVSAKHCVWANILELRLQRPERDI